MKENFGAAVNDHPVFKYAHVGSSVSIPKSEKPSVPNSLSSSANCSKEFASTNDISVASSSGSSESGIKNELEKLDEEKDFNNSNDLQKQKENKNSNSNGDEVKEKGVIPQNPKHSLTSDSSHSASSPSSSTLLPKPTDPSQFNLILRQHQCAKEGVEVEKKIEIKSVGVEKMTKEEKFEKRKVEEKKENTNNLSDEFIDVGRELDDFEEQEIFMTNGFLEMDYILQDGIRILSQGENLEEELDEYSTQENLMLNGFPLDKYEGQDEVLDCNDVNEAEVFQTLTSPGDLLLLDQLQVLDDLSITRTQLLHGISSGLSPSLDEGGFGREFGALPSELFGQTELNAFEWVDEHHVMDDLKIYRVWRLLWGRTVLG